MNDAVATRVTGDIERDLEGAAQLALDHARSQGASSAEVAIGQGQGMSVTVRRGEVETVEHNRDKSIGVTVYFGHHSGNASSTDFSERAIRDIVESACNIARYTEDDPFNGLADPDRLATEFPDLDLHHPWNLDMDTAIELATACERSALEADSRIGKTEGATVSSHDGVDLYANSHGFSGFSRGSRHSLSCSVIAGEGEGMQRDYWYDSRRRREDLMAPEAVGAETARRTLRRLGAKKIDTGEFPVVYESGVASSLVSHLVSAISGANLYRKSSFLADRLGEKIFPENIQLHEQPFLPRATGSAAFDAEGVATRENRVIQDGVLNSYILNSYAARKLEMQSTGNAGGTHNLTLDPTMDGGLEALLAAMGTGVLVTELIGFGVNTVTGDYSRGAFGFWVENGDIQYPVQEFTVAGNLNDMFSRLLEVGSDVDDRRNIRTGSILVEKMTVAGQ